MDDKLKELVKKDNIQIPESFDKMFEESLNKLPKHNTNKSRFLKVASIIIITTLIGTTAVIAITNARYKYIKTNGVIIENKDKVYGMNNLLKRKDKNESDVSLDMQIINDRAIINLGGKHYTPNLEKSELKIGNEVYINNNIQVDELKYSWGVSDVFYNIKNYDIKDKIVYTLYTKDDENIEFDITLKEISGVDSYEELGITSTYNNIPITAIINESEESLIIDFISEKDHLNIIPGVDDFDGIYTDIYLTDKNNNKVEGMRKINNANMKYNRVEFDIRNTERPYKIEIPQVSIDYSVYETDNIQGDDVVIEVPKDNETIDLEKEIKLYTNDDRIKISNDTILLKSVKRESDKVMVNIEYPENKTDKDYLRQVLAIENKLIKKNNLVFSRSYYDKNEKLVNILEFDVNTFQKHVKFKLSPAIYDIKGDWQFVID